MHVYSARYSEALALAAELHAGQRRKNADVPYLSHLLAVSSIVWEDGGDEDQAIAALLHDAIEDQGDRITLDDISSRFGTEVADIVAACTDSSGSQGAEKPPWIQRKADHLESLAHAPPRALQVLAADKLHNVRSLLDDRRSIGPDVWRRFNGRLLGTVWYYTSVCQLLTEALPASASRTPLLLADACDLLERCASQDLAEAEGAAWLAPEGWPPHQTLQASA